MRRTYRLLSFHSFNAVLSKFIKKQNDVIHEHKIVLNNIIAFIFIYMIWVEHYEKAESQETYYFKVFTK